MVECVGGARILLLTTYRPGGRPPWLGKSSVTQLVLPPLAPQDSWSLVHSILPTEQRLNCLARQIIAKAEGNPFFLEEIVQTLAQQGGPEIQLPGTVQKVPTACIDRLPAAANTLLQTLAVFGCECSWQLLPRVVDQLDEPLRRWLMHLQATDFLCEQPSLSELTSMFKHAPVKDVAYASLPQEQRQQLHGRAAQAIEALFHERLTEHACELAYHYRHSGNHAKAAQYLQLLGQQASSHSTYAGAMGSPTTDSEPLYPLPDTSERDEQELVLHTRYLARDRTARLAEPVHRQGAVAAWCAPYPPSFLNLARCLDHRLASCRPPMTGLGRLHAHVTHGFRLHFEYNRALAAFRMTA